MPHPTVRHPSIDVAGVPMPPLWLGNDAFRTHLFNAMSMMFPIGEQYFIDAVRAGAARVSDPALADTVRGFIGQEATHTRLHRIFNRRLAEQGLRNHVEPLIALRIRWSDWLDDRSKMAVAMAYEHFTATFGDAVLGGASWLDGASPPMRALWEWHAVEECEHRAVVFDVYRAGGGGYGRRVGWFLYVSVLFFLDSLVQTTANLHRGGHLFRPSTWGQGLRFLFGRGGLAAWMLVPWLSYLRPGFSPRDHGDDAAVSRWLSGNRAWFAAQAGEP